MVNQILKFAIVVSVLALVVMGTTNPLNPVPQVPVSYSALTDRSVRPEPSIQGAIALGTRASGRGVNYRFLDPVFNTPILRVTDDQTNPNPGYTNRSYSTTNSSENANTNTDSTLLIVKGEGGEYVPLSHDKTNHAVSRMGSPSIASGGIWFLPGSVDSEPSFSYRENKILWAIANYSIRKYDFTSVTAQSASVPYTTLNVNPVSIYTTLLGVAPEGSVSGITVSGGSTSEWVGFAYGGIQDTWRAVLIVNSATLEYFFLDTRKGDSGNTRVYSSAALAWTVTNIPGQWGLHNVKISRNGRYVTMTAVPSPIAGQWDQVLWDTQTQTISTILDSGTNLAAGHKVNGYNSMLNDTGDIPATSLPLTAKRPFSSMITVTELMAPRLTATTPYTGDSHLSWNNVQADDSQPVLDMFLRGVDTSPIAPWRTWDNELDLIATAGPSVVWRIAHHHAVAYPSTLFGCGSPNSTFIYTANISQDGQFALFTSNWGCTLGGQYHVFLAELRAASSAPAPTPTPTPAPSPTPTPTPSNVCKPNQLISSGCTCITRIVGPSNKRRCK